jgi:hypothetical protein
MPIRTLSALVLSVLLGALLGACGGTTPTPSSVTTFCTDGKVTCIGNVLATCVGGKAYQTSSCGENKYCSAGQCQDIHCEKGSLTCSGPDLMQCPSNGSTDPGKLQTCANGCTKGACVPASCKDGDTLCGWRTVLTCSGGSWKPTPCANGQLCTVSGKVASCVDRTCAPDSVQCKSKDVAQVCSTMGDKFTDKACGAGNGCFDGVCHPLVKGQEPDATTGGTDTSSGADTDSATSGKDTGHGSFDAGGKDVVLEQNDILKVIVSEKADPGSGVAPVEFELASATWNDGLKMLQLTGTVGLNKIEIQLAKIDEFSTGSFTAAGGEAPDSAIFYNDGTSIDPKTQWKFGAADYTITIDTFGAPGGRVIGSFSATMADTEVKGKKIYFVDGVFDIARK